MNQPQYTFKITTSYSDGSGREVIVTGSRGQIGEYVAQRLPTSGGGRMTIEPSQAMQL